MSLLRQLTVALGVLAVLVGLASVATGGSLGFGLDYLFVTLVGLVALVQGLRYAAARRSATLPFTATGDPELRREVPVPGGEFDDRLAGSEGWSFRSVRVRESVRERLTEATVAALVDYRGLSRAEAERRVASGEWTDDAVAAGLLAEGEVDRGRLAALRGLFRRESRYRRAVRRTLAEVDAVQRGEP